MDEVFGFQREFNLEFDLEFGLGGGVQRRVRAVGGSLAAHVGGV